MTPVFLYHIKLFSYRIPTLYLKSYKNTASNKFVIIQLNSLKFTYNEKLNISWIMYVQVYFVYLKYIFTLNCVQVTEVKINVIGNPFEMSVLNLRINFLFIVDILSSSW